MFFLSSDTTGTTFISQQAAVVAEWLRRLTRNQIPSGSVGSNPTDCEMQYFFSKKANIPFCSCLLWKICCLPLRFKSPVVLAAPVVVAHMTQWFSTWRRRGGEGGRRVVCFLSWSYLYGATVLSGKIVVHLGPERETNRNSLTENGVTERQFHRQGRIN